MIMKGTRDLRVVVQVGVKASRISERGQRRKVIVLDTDGSTRKCCETK
jgi:hypothetical protein